MCVLQPGQLLKTMHRQTARSSVGQSATLIMSRSLVQLQPCRQNNGAYPLCLINSRKGSWQHVGSNPTAPTSHEIYDSLAQLVRASHVTDNRHKRVVIVGLRDVGSSPSGITQFNNVQLLELRLQKKEIQVVTHLQVKWRWQSPNEMWGLNDSVAQLVRAVPVKRDVPQVRVLLGSPVMQCKTAQARYS